MRNAPSQTFDPNTPDETIFEVFRTTGSNAAFDTLYRRHSPGVGAYLRKFLRDEHTADDALQQTFIKVHQNHQQFNPLYKFRVWVYTIAGNCAVDLQRASACRPALSLSVCKKASGELIDYDPADMRVDESSEIVARDEAVQELRDALRLLSARDQKLIDLIHFQGQSYAQAAQQTGLPLGTVKSQMHRALANLREIMSPVKSESAVA